MSKKNEEIIAGIKKHQTSRMVHPLTCGNAACRAVLEAFEDNDKKIKLGCPNCDYVQDNIPPCLGGFSQ